MTLQLRPPLILARARGVPSRRAAAASPAASPSGFLQGRKRGGVTLKGHTPCLSSASLLYALTPVILLLWALRLLTVFFFFSGLTLLALSRLLWPCFCAVVVQSSFPTGPLVRAPDAQAYTAGPVLPATDP